ncbi:DUF421 domain-containing protein [Paenibacillus swuensis]|uniref:DUF421 domain-containing protein n=1 Tax=Paenibacillus swuensis TaxID=1178515 RepID=UPI0018D4C873|nr:DUF421 domain-containing protein [Paenibacillus swuensis]
MSDELNILIRALGSIFSLFILTRILGKKQISQLTFFEYITGIALGELAGIMSTDLEFSYVHGFIALSVWAFVPLAVELLALRSKTVRNLLEGQSRVFIRNGVILKENLKKERYSSDELLEQLRKKSVFNVADVEFALLETSGEFNILLKKEHQTLTPHMLGMHVQPEQEPQTVIMDGQILRKTLAPRGITEEWLLGELDRRKVSKEQVYLGQLNANNRLYLDLYHMKPDESMGELPQVRLLHELRSCTEAVNAYLTDAGQGPVNEELLQFRRQTEQCIKLLLRDDHSEISEQGESSEP